MTWKRTADDEGLPFRPPPLPLLPLPPLPLPPLLDSFSTRKRQWQLLLLLRLVQPLVVLVLVLVLLVLVLVLLVGGRRGPRALRRWSRSGGSSTPRQASTSAQAACTPSRAGDAR